MWADQRLEAQAAAQPADDGEPGGGQEPLGVEALEAGEVLGPVPREQEGEQEPQYRGTDEDDQSPSDSGDRYADNGRPAPLLRPVLRAQLSLPPRPDLPARELQVKAQPEARSVVVAIADRAAVSGAQVHRPPAAQNDLVVAP